MSDWRTIGAVGEPALMTDQLVPKDDGIRYKVEDGVLMLDFNADFVPSAVERTVTITAFMGFDIKVNSQVTINAYIMGVLREAVIQTERDWASFVTKLTMVIPPTQEDDTITEQGVEVPLTFAVSYSTGWVANSDWTNAELTATHGLDTPLSDLIVKFFVSADGTETGALEVFPQGMNTGFSAGDYGFTVFAIGDDSIKVQTAHKGIFYTADTGYQNIIDTEAWYYKIKVYKLG